MRAESRRQLRTSDQENETCATVYSFNSLECRSTSPMISLCVNCDRKDLSTETFLFFDADLSSYEGTWKCQKGERIAKLCFKVPTAYLHSPKSEGMDPSLAQSPRKNVTKTQPREIVEPTKPWPHLKIWWR